MATRCESAVCAATTSYLQPICLRLRRFLTQHNRVRQLARVRDSRMLVRPLMGVSQRGAGTAAILAMLLRPAWPELRCFAYSPPGGLISDKASESTKAYITSVTLGDDFIGALARLLSFLVAATLAAVRVMLAGQQHSLLFGACT